MTRTAMATRLHADERHRAQGPSPRHGGFSIGSAFGVRLQVDWSLLIIFVLILFNLGAGLFPAWHPDWSAALIWSTALGAAVLFFASILAHELSHAVVGRKNGIPVSRITLFLFGGLAHMDREPPSAKSEFLMAIAGPIMSVAIGAVAITAGSVLAGPEFASNLADDPEAALSSLGPLASLLLWLGPINVLLGLFNLVPGFPLDGGRVFRSIAWWVTDDLRKATLWASGAGRLFAWALMAFGLINVLGGAFVQGLWLLLIGWFLNNAAGQSYQQLVIRETLQDVPLARMMRTRIATVGADTSVDTLVRDELMTSDQRAFPVVDANGQLAGLVCLEDVRKVPQARWTETRLSEIMTPREELSTLPSDASADRAFKALAERGVDQIPVLEDDRPVGLVRSQDLMKWLSLHA